MLQYFPACSLQLQLHATWCGACCPTSHGRRVPLIILSKTIPSEVPRTQEPCEFNKYSNQLFPCLSVTSSWNINYGSYRPGSNGIWLLKLLHVPERYLIYVKRTLILSSSQKEIRWCEILKAISFNSHMPICTSWCTSLFVLWTIQISNHIRINLKYCH